MPDGGATETVVAEEILAEGAAETVAEGAAAAATEQAGAAALALEGAGELSEVPALATEVGGVGDASIIGGHGADQVTASEITGSGPAAQTGEAVTTSNTDKLAQQVLNGPNAAEAGKAADLSMTGGVPSSQAANFVGTPQESGIINSAVNWADKHPMAATIAGTQIAGAVGGVGKAALEKEMAERNIRARSDLLTQQSAADLQRSRSGAVPGGGVRVQPRGGLVRRPDGTLVFAPAGIVNSNIQGG